MKFLNKYMTEICHFHQVNQFNFPDIVCKHFHQTDTLSLIDKEVV